MTTFSPQQYKNVTYTLNHNFNSGWEAIVDDKKFHAKNYGQIHKQFTEYIDSLVPEEDEKEQIQYGQEVLATDLFNDVLYNYPEALPEVIKFLDQLQDRYKGE